MLSLLQDSNSIVTNEPRKFYWGVVTLRRTIFVSFLLCVLFATVAFAQSPEPSSRKTSSRRASSREPSSSKLARFLPAADSPIQSPIVVSVPVSIKPTPNAQQPWYSVSLSDVLPALITLVANLCLAWFGFILFRRSYEQRERHLKEERSRFDLGQRNLQDQFESAQLNTLSQFDKKQQQDRILADAKAAQERLMAARKEIQDQYADVQNCFSQLDPAMKVSAALRLGEFSETLDPEKSVGSPRIAQNHRYFIPVAQQLASALVLEEAVPVRNAIRDALKRMTLFASKESEQVLLHELIVVLAEANRRAKDAFIGVMAEWAVATHAAKQETLRFPTGILMDKDIDLLAQVTTFCGVREDSVICLRSLMAEKEERIHWSRNYAGKVMKPGTYARSKMVYAAKRSVQNVAERMASEVLLLSRLEATGQQLNDARETLATTLRVLESPKFFKSPKNRSDSATSKEWVRQPELNLSECFLAGVNLEWVHLQGADLTGAHLIGANLGEAQLQEANLRGAQLQRANCRNMKADGVILTDARLDGADLTQGSFMGGTLVDASLEKANLKEAHLDGANLSYAHLKDCDLRLAYLIDTFLTEAQLPGADLAEAHLEGADLRKANLGGASLSEAHLERANLMGTHLHEANMRSAHLVGANLGLANLVGAYLREAHLEGANLRSASLEGAYLYGIYVQENETSAIHQTCFDGANLKGAKFTAADPNWQIVDGDLRTERVKEWLAAKFPKEWGTWTHGASNGTVMGDSEREMVANVVILMEKANAVLQQQ